MNGTNAVLIIDDDPTHLKIYGWIVNAAGYEALPALVRSDRIEFPQKHIDVVVMDYRLTGQITAVQAAELTQSLYPGAPIIVLSDVYDLPADIAPYARAFVRKGEPAKLVEALAKFSGRSEGFADTA